MGRGGKKHRNVSGTNIANSVETCNSCTCGRYLGMSDEEKIHHAVDNFFGVKTEFKPKTPEELAQIETDKIKALEEKKEYLIKCEINIQDLSIEQIESAYKKCKYDNMTSDEKKNYSNVLAANYNIIRILRGWEPIAYSN